MTLLANGSTWDDADYTDWDKDTDPWVDPNRPIGEEQERELAAFVDALLL